MKKPNYSFEKNKREMKKKKKMEEKLAKKLERKKLEQETPPQPDQA